MANDDEGGGGGGRRRRSGHIDAAASVGAEAAGLGGAGPRTHQRKADGRDRTPPAAGAAAPPPGAHSGSVLELCGALLNVSRVRLLEQLVLPLVDAQLMLEQLELGLGVEGIETPTGRPSASTGGARYEGRLRAGEEELNGCHLKDRGSGAATAAAAALAPSCLPPPQLDNCRQRQGGSSSRAAPAVRRQWLRDNGLLSLQLLREALWQQTRHH
eukprot:GHVU01052959.1.p1 GENE.GHVU01052959.1~~GHVU01052959.1.p1  ORF type:complete len:233 (-),score=61.29 GHVU01052959.1:106-747(-)